MQQSLLLNRALVLPDKSCFAWFLVAFRTIQVLRQHVFDLFRPTHLISRNQHFFIPTLNLTSVSPHTHPAMNINMFLLFNKPGQNYTGLIFVEKKILGLIFSEKKISHLKKHPFKFWVRKMIFLWFIAHIIISEWSLR